MITLGRWILRTLWITAATAAIVVALRTMMGPARRDRLYVQDEVARFHPTGGHGLGQLAGETFLVVLCAWGARRWLRVKL
jgi:hypothetical protein